MQFQQFPINVENCGSFEIDVVKDAIRNPEIISEQGRALEIMFAESVAHYLNILNTANTPSLFIEFFYCSFA